MSHAVVDPSHASRRDKRSAAKDKKATTKTVTHPLDKYFLSREDHLDFRSCAKLNSAIDTHLFRPAGLPTVLLEAESPPTFEFILKTHCAILVCKNEVIAAVVSGTWTKPPADVPGVLEIASPKIVIAANPRFEDYPSAQTDKSVAKDPHKYKVALSTSDVTGDGPPPQGAVEHVLLNPIVDSIKFKRAQRDSFTQHVRTYFQYLRATHVATTQYEYKAAVESLRAYVYTRSFAKMLSRFESGGNAKSKGAGSDVNFWAIMTRASETFPDHASPIPIPSHLRFKKPNAAQAAIIIEVFRNESTYSQALGTMTVYTTAHDRIRFHNMLRFYLLRAKQGLAILAERMKDYAKNKDAATSTDVNDALSIASGGMIVLLNFLDAFGPFLTAHFEWLAQVANVVDCKAEPTWTVTVVQTPVQPLKPESPQKVSTLEDDEADEVNDDLEVFLTAQQTARQAQSAHDVAVNPHHAWVQAAKTFVRLTCLHEASLRRATVGVPGRKTAAQLRESALIAEAQVTVVKFDIPAWDKEVAIIDHGFIKKLTKFAPAVDPTKLLGPEGEKGAVGFLNDGKIMQDGSLIQPQNPNCKGAPHCESILMSLIAISKDKEIMSHITDEFLEHNGIFISTQALLELFSKTIAMVAVSKKPCPPCEFARKAMRESGVTEVNFVAPGSHQKWSHILLPILMPKKLGQSVVQSTKHATAQKLLAFQQLCEASEAAAKIKQKESPQSEEHLAPPGLYAPVASPGISMSSPGLVMDEDFSTATYEAAKAAEAAVSQAAKLVAIKEEDVTKPEKQDTTGPDIDDNDQDQVDISMAEDIEPKPAIGAGVGKRGERDFTEAAQGEEKKEKLAEDE